MSRKKNEIVDIITPSGDRITVAVVELRGEKCRLGFIADKEIAIHRRETTEKILAAGKAVLPGGQMARMREAAERGKLG